MACMGPSRDEAYAAGDQIITELLIRLKAERGMGRDSFMRDSAKKEWDEHEQKLREAMRELFWLDWAESF